MIKIRTRRWAGILILAALAFAQASVAFAACSMERGMLGAMAISAGAECEACDMPKHPVMDSANQCVAHCTADLQQVPHPVVIVPSPAVMPVLWLEPPPAPPIAPKGLLARPPSAPPHRILLHSFLI